MTMLSAGRVAQVGSRSAVALGWRQGRLEIAQFVASRESVVFTIAFPVLMLVGFGLIAGYDEVDGVSFGEYFTPCMVAAGVFATGFQSVAIALAMERERGLHRRLAVTPLPIRSFLIGKVLLVAASSVVTSVVLLAVARLGYGVGLPPLSRWPLLVTVYVVGVVVCTAWGVAASRIPRTARAAPAVLTPLALVVQAMSGIFVPLSEFPDFLRNVAYLSPLTWLVAGFRAAFGVHGEAGNVPPAGLAVAVLASSAVIGVLVCRAVFRWRAR